MRNRLGAAIVIAGLCGATNVAAQEQIQWKQVSNIAKGANLPPGVKGDILGIELGDSYAAVAARLQTLLAGGIPQAPVEDSASSRMLGQASEPPIREAKIGYRLPLAAGGSIEAAFVGQIHLARKLKGTGAQPIDEWILVHLSAPSSGHQVYKIERRIAYYERGDQVRIGETLKAISDKFKSNPQDLGYAYLWQFNDGRPFVTKDASRGTCSGPVQNVRQDEVKDINRFGDCDVLLQVTFTHGISQEHARVISFELTDFERSKANHQTDYAFFESYVEDLRKRTSGTAPKL